MPRFDGTGPMGKGVFTGRGMGYCIAQVGTKGRENKNNKKKSSFF